MSRLVLSLLVLFIFCGARPSLAILFKLQIQLDHNPEETAWQLRGPVPKPDIIDGVTYGYYKEAQSTIEESFDIEAGKYWIWITDRNDDGISESSWQLIAHLAGRDVVLHRGDGQFGAGKLQEILVPSEEWELHRLDLPEGQHPILSE